TERARDSRHGDVLQRGAGAKDVAEEWAAAGPCPFEPVREPLLLPFPDQAGRAALPWPRLHVRQAAPKIGCPARFRKLPVIDDVDAHLCLLADHLGDGALDPRLQRGIIVWLPKVSR